MYPNETEPSMLQMCPLCFYQYAILFCLSASLCSVQSLEQATDDERHCLLSDLQESQQQINWSIDYLGSPGRLNRAFSYSSAVSSDELTSISAADLSEV